MAHHKSDKCKKWNKQVCNTSKHVVCSQCSNSPHFKCSELSKKDYLGYQQKAFLYTFQFCADYKYIKSEKHVYYSQKGILCSGCDLWVHKKCAGLNNSQYELIQDNPNYPWYCRPCKNDMFSFFGHYQFFNYIDSQKLMKPKFSWSKQVTKNIKCSVCNKNNSLNRRLNCSSCDTPVHKKYTKLKQGDFIFNKITQNTYWECIACQNAKFPFPNIPIMKYNF